LEQSNHCLKKTMNQNRLSAIRGTLLDSLKVMGRENRPRVCVTLEKMFGSVGLKYKGFKEHAEKVELLFEFTQDTENTGDTLPDLGSVVRLIGHGQKDS
jgi:hypothetical protein